MPQRSCPTHTGAPGHLEFEHLVRRHQAMVFSIAFHFLQDRSAAEELAQDVFLQLHQHLPSLASPEHVTFWLRRVAAHRCIDYRRRRKLAFLSLDAAPGPRADARTRDPWLSRRLHGVIASLSRKARLVVILRYQEDLTPDQIAAVMSIPVATAKSQLQRSLAMHRLQVFVQGQNLTNQPNYLGYSGTLTSPFFGKPTAVSDMRKVDAGISLTF
jgi:RNA polymerase sigma-70 factor, ECF subfamily